MFCASCEVYDLVSNHLVVTQFWFRTLSIKLVQTLRRSHSIERWKSKFQPLNVLSEGFILFGMRDF